MRREAKCLVHVNAAESEGSRRREEGTQLCAAVQPRLQQLRVSSGVLLSAAAMYGSLDEKWFRLRVTLQKKKSHMILSTSDHWNVDVASLHSAHVRASNTPPTILSPFQIQARQEISVAPPPPPPK